MYNVWQLVLDVFRQDFADLPDLRLLIQLTLRLLLAAILGGLLGYERERAGKPAGMRTYMLVSLGAALLVLVPQQAGMQTADLSRVIQGLVTGIGFIGAGAILKEEGEHKVVGLTTAAGIWLIAAIGMTVGIGHDFSAILTTLLALVILSVLPHVERRVARRRQSQDSTSKAAEKDASPKE